MNRQETIKVLAYLREIYPSGKEVTKNTVSVWNDLLEKYPFEVVWEATKNAVRKWQGMIMPPPSVIIEQVENLKPQDKSNIELWRIVEKQIRKGTSLTQEEFQQLPRPIQAYFGGVSGIKDLAMLDLKEIPNERARFLNHIGKITEREKAQRQLPDNVKAIINQTTKRLGQAQDDQNDT